MNSISIKLFFSVISALPVMALAQPEQSWFDKAFGALGQSTPVYLFGKYCMQPINWVCRKRLGDVQPASPELQKKWEDVQNAVGIPKHKQIPVFVVSKFPNESTVAIAEADIMYVVSDFEQRSYSSQMKTLFHEAMHVKYADKATDVFLGAVLGTAYGIVTSTLISIARHQLRGSHYGQNIYDLLCKIAPPSLINKGVNSLSWTIQILSSHLIFSKMVLALSRYEESRADTQGAYASACAFCVDEIAKDAYGRDGYLTEEQFREIAYDLLKEEKACAHHKDEMDEFIKNLNSIFESSDSTVHS